MNDYSVEPLMSDTLKSNLQKYYSEVKNVEELCNLIERYGWYICSDKLKDFELTENEKDRLIELLLKLCLFLSGKPALYENEYYYMKKHWYPDWEICWRCSKRYTQSCHPDKCDPLDI